MKKIYLCGPINGCTDFEAKGELVKSAQNMVNMLFDSINNQ